MKFNTIRKKIIGYGLILTILVSTLLYFFLNFSIVKGVNELEDITEKRNIQRLENGLDSYFQFLVQKSGDWAKWDVSYDFIDSVNEDFINENMTVEAFSVIDVNMMLFLNNEGELVYQNAVNINQGEFEAIPEEILASLSEIKQMMEKRREGQSAHGFISVKGKPPLLFVSHHILKSDGSGPANGTLIMAKYADDTFIQSLAKNTIFPVHLEDLDEAALPTDFLKAKELILSTGHSTYIDHHTTSISSYILYSDIFGKPSFILKVVIPREYIAEYLRTVSYSLLSIFIGGLLLSFLGYLYIKKHVLTPLSLLQQGVEGIFNGSNQAEFRINGKDEIAHLAKRIKKIVQQLAIAEEQMAAKNQDLEKMNKFMIGREIKMAELKAEIKRLKNLDQ